jgi:hypothetical protein
MKFFQRKTSLSDKDFKEQLKVTPFSGEPRKLYSRNDVPEWLLKVANTLGPITNKGYEYWMNHIMSEIDTIRSTSWYKGYLAGHKISHEEKRPAIAKDLNQIPGIQLNQKINQSDQSHLK